MDRMPESLECAWSWCVVDICINLHLDWGNLHEPDSLQPPPPKKKKKKKKKEKRTLNLKLRSFKSLITNISGIYNSIIKLFNHIQLGHRVIAKYGRTGR